MRLFMQKLVSSGEGASRGYACFVSKKGERERPLVRRKALLRKRTQWTPRHESTQLRMETVRGCF
jgi:hypothetical protein